MSQRLGLPSPGHRTHENANASRISALAQEISFKLLAIAEYPTVPFFPSSFITAGRSSDFIPPFFNPVCFTLSGKPFNLLLFVLAFVIFTRGSQIRLNVLSCPSSTSLLHESDECGLFYCSSGLESFFQPEFVGPVLSILPPPFVQSLSHAILSCKSHSLSGTTRHIVNK